MRFVQREMETVAQVIALLAVSFVLALPTAALLLFADRRWPVVFASAFAGSFAILATRALAG